MEYSLSELYKSVLFTLSLNPNKKFRLDELYQEIIKNGSCPELSTFYYTRSDLTLVTACEKAIDTYQNIHFDGKTYYLETNNNKETINNYNIGEISKIIKNPTEHDFSLEKIYQNGQTILHILCEMHNDKLLNELHKSFNIDLTIKNNIGKSVLDVVPYDNQDFVKLLLKIMAEQSSIYHNIYTSELKTKTEKDLLVSEIRIKNNVLLEENNTLRNKISYLEKEILKLNKVNIFSTFFFWLLCVIFLCVACR